MTPAACLDEVGERQTENLFKMSMPLTYLHLTISHRDTSIHIYKLALYVYTLRFLCNVPEQQQTVLNAKQADKEGLEKKLFNATKKD